MGLQPNWWKIRLIWENWENQKLFRVRKTAMASLALLWTCVTCAPPWHFISNVKKSWRNVLQTLPSRSSSTSASCKQNRLMHCCNSSCHKASQASQASLKIAPKGCNSNSPISCQLLWKGQGRPSLLWNWTRLPLTAQGHQCRRLVNSMQV